jgi:ParB family chromosome partitioning protein
MAKDERRGRRKALGKGLGALIPQKSDRDKGFDREFAFIPVAQIGPAEEQPRKRFDPDAIAELAQSIEGSGLIQPLVVRAVGDRYELIAGERRWRACQVAEVEEVPVVIKDLSDREAFTLALVENVQREDLSPLEEALAYRRLIDEFEFTQQTVANEVGKSRSAVANALRLLNLPTPVREYLEAGDLSAGHARSLAALGEEEAVELAEIMVRHGYSVREAEELVRESKVPESDSEESEPSTVTGGTTGSRYRDDAQVRRVTEELQRALGTRIKVKDRHGKGRIEIHYDNYEVLQDVLDRLLTE